MPTSDGSGDSPGGIKRDRKAIERPFGKTFEAGRDSKFVSSPSRTVHKRELIDEDVGYTLDPICGQTLSESSLWGGIDADSAKDVAEEYGFVSFCTKCFSKSLHLERLGQEARK